MVESWEKSSVFLWTEFGDKLIMFIPKWLILMRKAKLFKMLSLDQYLCFVIVCSFCPGFMQKCGLFYIDGCCMLPYHIRLCWLCDRSIHLFLFDEWWTLHWSYWLLWLVFSLLSWTRWWLNCISLTNYRTLICASFQCGISSSCGSDIFPRNTAELLPVLNLICLILVFTLSAFFKGNVWSCFMNLPNSELVWNWTRPYWFKFPFF